MSESYYKYFCNIFLTKSPNIQTYFNYEFSTTSLKLNKSFTGKESHKFPNYGFKIRLSKLNTAQITTYLSEIHKKVFILASKKFKIY